VLLRAVTTRTTGMQEQRHAAAQMAEAGIAAQTAGLRMSVMVLLGLGGANRTPGRLPFWW